MVRREDREGCGLAEHPYVGMDNLRGRLAYSPRDPYLSNPAPNDPQVCTVISCVVSFYLMYRHATNYTRPREQRQILRILLMVPVYSITTMFSYVWYWHAVYWEVGRDFYEAFAIASFFALLCQYVGENLRTQKEFFAAEMEVKPWPWPATWFNRCCGGRFMKTPSNGLTWFNIVWICVFQYCFVRVATTLLALGTQITGTPPSPVEKMWMGAEIM